MYPSGFPYEGKLSAARLTDEVDSVTQTKLPPPHPSRLMPCHLPLIGEGFGACKYRNLPRKKVQTSKSGLHLLLTAHIQRQLVANLMPTVSGGAYQDARKVIIVWDARPKRRC